LPFKYTINELIPDQDQFPPDWNNWKVNQESLDIENPMEKSMKKIPSEIDPQTGQRYSLKPDLFKMFR
jgi:hypothetical protein